MADPIAILAPAGTASAPPSAQRRLVRYLRLAELWVPALVLVSMLFACFALPRIVTLPDPVAGDLNEANLGLFSPGHPFGTDPLGNDNLSRLLHGGQVSLSVGLGAVALGLVIGSTIGIVGGYLGGVVDVVVSRLLDMVLAFPALVLAMVIANLLGPSQLNVTLAVSLFSVPAFARIARSSTQRVREQPFVLAAKLLGSRDWSVMLRHVLPNILPELVTFSLLSISIAVIIEASLSFLGLGVRPPTPTWGGMIAVGQERIYTPYLLLLPCAFLFVTVLALNLLGDAVRTRWSSR